ncbi:unnamed protein product [Scytosiphon promiscuus]
MVAAVAREDAVAAAEAAAARVATREAAAAAKAAGEAGRALLSGQDWYLQEAFRAENQALGRCIRHIYDYGVICLIDERFRLGGKNHVKYLAKWVRGLLGEYSSLAEMGDTMDKLFASAPGFVKAEKDKAARLRQEASAQRRAKAAAAAEERIATPAVPVAAAAAGAPAVRGAGKCDVASGGGDGGGQRGGGGDGGESSGCDSGRRTMVKRRKTSGNRDGIHTGGGAGLPCLSPAAVVLPSPKVEKTLPASSQSASSQSASSRSASGQSASNQWSSGQSASGLSDVGCGCRGNGGVTRNRNQPSRTRDGGGVSAPGQLPGAEQGQGHEGKGASGGSGAGDCDGGGGDVGVVGVTPVCDDFCIDISGDCGDRKEGSGGSPRVGKSDSPSRPTAGAGPGVVAEAVDSGSGSVCGDSDGAEEEQGEANGGDDVDVIDLTAMEVVLTQEEDERAAVFLMYDGASD